MSARKILVESTTHIDVDGELRHRLNSEGNPIHHTDDGIKNFHKWFGDSDSVDEHGRPLVMHHSVPALSGPQRETTPLPFKEFSKTESGVFSFAKTPNFAENYARDKSQHAGMDLSPYTFKTYLKTKTFDPDNQAHIELLKKHLGDKVTHYDKYGVGALGGKKVMDKSDFIEKLQGLHDAPRPPLTKEMHETAEAGKTITVNGSNLYVLHKTPTHLFFTQPGMMSDLTQDHKDELRKIAQTEPADTVNKTFKVRPTPWDIKTVKVKVQSITHVPTTEKEKGDNWNYTENDEFKAAAAKAGFNAVKQTERGHQNIAVFGGDQIKSATHNTGGFTHPTKIDE